MMIAVTYSTFLFVSTLLFNVFIGIINSTEPPVKIRPVEIPPDATDINDDVEHRMAYWREDIGTNVFHWHWHICHPYTGPEFIVKKHRRGELFYYLHQQTIASDRWAEKGYNVERHCNGLNFVSSFSNWSEPIPEAYFPMLSPDVAGTEWSSRSANMIADNVKRSDVGDGERLYIEDLNHYAKRILEDVDRRKVINTDGTEISIDNDQGIDILGDIVEASDLSPNIDYYGDIHNDGHVAIGYINDPQDRYHLPGGVMSKVETAMRDPIFYRWHGFLNDIFLKHKAYLRAYNEKDLSFPDVEVTNVELHSHRNGKYRNAKNTLHTYMMKSDFNMSRGIDFSPRSPVLVRVTHQNHDDFDYTIECVNRSQRRLLGAVRIFIVPVIGPGDYPMKLLEQGLLAIEMDRFVEPLEPGINKIVRRSTMSSMTIPFEQTFRDLDSDRPRDDEYEELDKFNSCGCGWPQHLLVPRGTADGYPMLLFAIITDYNIEQADVIGNATLNGCRISVFCALRHNKKYPYKRPVGFPFDRPVRSDADSIEAFLTPNMAIKPITIFHSDRVIPGRLLSNAKPRILGQGV